MKMNAKRVSRLLITLVGCLTVVRIAHAQQSNPQVDYFARLASLCEERFEGAMTFPDDEQHDFANKVLVAEFKSCSETEVRVPFQVGSDHSRTWIFRKLPGAIELKHDHRHYDGSADDISNYGGTTIFKGTASMQSFPADEFTQNLIPDAATNVWNVSLNADKSELTYRLERHNKPRFSAVLRRVVTDD